MEKNIRKLIDEAYPLNERKKLVKDGPVTITVRPLNSAGNISGRRISLDIDNGMNNSTVVHEGTHLLRKADDDRNSKITRSMIKSNSRIDSKLLNIEESCTVAEQMARGKNPSSGYYRLVRVYDEKKKRWRYPNEEEALRMMNEDRMLLTNGTNKPLSGNAAVKSVEKNWEKSHISRLKMNSSCKTAVEDFKDLDKKAVNDIRFDVNNNRRKSNAQKKAVPRKVSRK